MYPTNVDHQQNIFKIGNPSGEPEENAKKKKKKSNVFPSIPSRFRDIVIFGVIFFDCFVITKKRTLMWTGKKKGK